MLTLDIPLLGIYFYLENLPLVGNLRSKQLFQSPPPKLNIVLWLQLPPITWTVHLLEERGVCNLKLVTHHCNNMSALNIAHNLVLHDRTKHIEINCHFTREKVMDGLLQLTYLPTSSQLADVFTKILPSSQFQTLLSKLGMCNTPQA